MQVNTNDKKKNLKKGISKVYETCLYGMYEALKVLRSSLWDLGRVFVGKPW